MEASNPKWVNPVLDIIWVSSLRVGDLQILYASFINFCEIKQLTQNFDLNEYIEIHVFGPYNCDGLY